MLWFLLLSICFNFSQGEPYSDSLARYQMFPMCAGVWLTNPQQCIQVAYPGGQLKRRLVVACDTTKKDTCAGMTVFSTAQKTITLSFRGTNTALELYEEAEITVYAQKAPWAAGGNVSKYWNDAFFSLWNAGLKDDVITLINQYPSYDFYVTGHSLGGALAVLAASYIAHLGIIPKNQMHLYTFGEPRVGDHGFSAAVNRDLPYAYRVTHNRDMVPHLPLRNMENYIHHKSEVNYKEDMSPGAPFTVCSNENESMKCSDGNIVDPSILDHVRYFNVTTVTFRENGCNYTASHLP